MCTFKRDENLSVDKEYGKARGSLRNLINKLELRIWSPHRDILEKNVKTYSVYRNLFPVDEVLMRVFCCSNVFCPPRQPNNHFFHNWLCTISLSLFGVYFWICQKYNNHLFTGKGSCNFDFFTRQSVFQDKRQKNRRFFKLWDNYILISEMFNVEKMCTPTQKFNVHNYAYISYSFARSYLQNTWSLN